MNDNRHGGGLTIIGGTNRIGHNGYSIKYVITLVTLFKQ